MFIIGLNDRKNACGGTVDRSMRRGLARVERRNTAVSWGFPAIFGGSTNQTSRAARVRQQR